MHWARLLELQRLSFNNKKSVVYPLRLFPPLTWPEKFSLYFHLYKTSIRAFHWINNIFLTIFFITLARKCLALIIARLFLKAALFFFFSPENDIEYPLTAYPNDLENIIPAKLILVLLSITDYYQPIYWGLSTQPCLTGNIFGLLKTSMSFICSQNLRQWNFKLTAALAITASILWMSSCQEGAKRTTSGWCTGTHQKSNWDTWQWT